MSLGDEILRTTDGGVTWRTVRDGPMSTDVYIRDLQWVGNIAVAASTGGLFRSGPLGSGWQSVSTRSDLYRLDFLTQTLGYVISDPSPQGGGTILLRTSDGGRSFTPVDPGLAPVQWVQFVSTQLGWAAGPLGIVVTRDGGVHWTRQLAFPSTAVDPGSPDRPANWTAQVGFRDALHGFAYFRTRYTLMNQSAGIVYYTSDGGITWQGKACTCGYISLAPEILFGAKPGLPGGATSDLDVTGTLSASFISADGVMNHTHVCSTFSAGAAWTCSELPFAGFSLGRMASLGASRWLVLNVIESREAVIATSVNSGASWSAPTTVTVD